MECNGLLKWIGRNGMDEKPRILGNVLLLVESTRVG
jgi:hypothetical protein